MPTSSRSASLVLVSCAAVLAGCSQSVGGTQCSPGSGGSDGGTGSGEVMCVRSDGPGCDDFTTDQARTIVYREDGQPYYAGQALMLENCASCHSAGSTARFGAPAGLDFDANLVSAPGTAGIEEARHLLQIQATIHRHRDGIYSQTVGGAMPPRGFVPTSTRYAFADGTELPGIRDPEAHELLRHWLSCGSPVVERTTPDDTTCATNSDCPVTGFCDIVATRCVGVGDVVPARVQELEPRWSVIYPRLIVTNCTSIPGACHVQGEAGGLRLDDVSSAYEALVGVPGGGPDNPSCMDPQPEYVIAGDADGSFLIHKLEGVTADGTPVCGSRMPVGPLLTTEQVDIIRMWIDAGAMDD